METDEANEGDGEGAEVGEGNAEGTDDDTDKGMGQICCVGVNIWYCIKVSFLCKISEVVL